MRGRITNDCENVLGRTVFTCAFGNDNEKHSACSKVGIASAGVAVFKDRGHHHHIRHIITLALVQVRC